MSRTGEPPEALYAWPADACLSCPRLLGTRSAGAPMCGCERYLAPDSESNAVLVRVTLDTLRIIRHAHATFSNRWDFCRSTRARCALSRFGKQLAWSDGPVWL
jgi:hypothetical protein